MSNAPQLTLLCFDRDRSMLLALERFLKWDRYRVIYTNDPVKALSLIRQGSVDVLLCDGESGAYEMASFFQEMNDLKPELVRLSVAKPWNPVDLRRSLKEILASAQTLNYPLSA